MQEDDPPRTVASLKDKLSVPEDPQPSNQAELGECRVLVVDDNIINCQVAKRVFQKFTSQVDATTVSSDAIDMHIRQAFDLILMDCQMPGLNGYQAAALIRAADTGSRHTVVIGWTSTLSQDERAKCLKAGMDDLIAKPIMHDDVQRILAPWAQPTSSLRLPDSASLEDDLTNTWQRFGPDFAELATIFQSDTPKRIAAMHMAAATGDIAGLATIAHILAGSCASMGASHMANMCRNLELCCRNAISSCIEQLLEEIQAEYIKAEAKIRTLLQSATL